MSGYERRRSSCRKRVLIAAEKRRGAGLFDRSPFGLRREKWEHVWIGGFVYQVDVIAVRPYVGHVEHAKHVALAIAHRDDYRCVIAMRTSDGRGYQVLDVSGLENRGG